MPMPPPKSLVLRAVEVYLRVVYADLPPVTIRRRVSEIQDAESDHLLHDVMEHDGSQNPTRYAVRLGNRLYPHMKLVVEACPDGCRWMCRADTHDRHCCPPPTDRDFPEFQRLMAHNQVIAEQVDAALADAGLLTFKAWLKEDLARRAAPTHPDAG